MRRTVPASLDLVERAELGLNGLTLEVEERIVDRPIAWW